MAPLRAALLATADPLAGLAWLAKAHVPGFPRELASGEIALTHEAFRRLKPWRGAAHPRELLMSRGLLSEIDKHILLFERWLLVTHLPTLGEDARRVIREFTTWQVLPGLRRRAATGPLNPNTRRAGGSQTKRATALLDWLDVHGSDLRRCSQADLDRWHGEHPGHAHKSRGRSRCGPCPPSGCPEPGCPPTKPPASADPPASAAQPATATAHRYHRPATGPGGRGDDAALRPTAQPDRAPDDQ
ncbi:MAG: hypothetical protein JO100_18485 [Pseudonocardia sp.]|nr:hypothetical protein [Pseudonocardia sp.]